LKADGTVVAVGVSQYYTESWRNIGPVNEEYRLRRKQGLCPYCGGKLGFFSKRDG